MSGLEQGSRGGRVYFLEGRWCTGRNSPIFIFLFLYFYFLSVTLDPSLLCLCLTSFSAFFLCSVSVSFHSQEGDGGLAHGGSGLRPVGSVGKGRENPPGEIKLIPKRRG